MAEPSNEETVHRYLAAHAANDYDAVGALRHPAWTVDWPQSGERVRGHANDRAIMDNWPGGLPTSAWTAHVVGSEDKWVVSPSFTMERIAGSGDVWWIDLRGLYPDGSTWFVAATVQLRGGRIFHERWVFGRRSRRRRGGPRGSSGSTRSPRGHRWSGPGAS